MCVLVVSNLMLAIGILTQRNRYPVPMLTLWLRLIVLVARFQKKFKKTALNTVVRDTYIKNSAGLSYVIFSLCLQA